MRPRPNPPSRVQFLILMSILFIVSILIGSWYEDSGSSNPQPSNARHPAEPINPHPTALSRRPSNNSLPEEIMILYWTRVFSTPHPSSKLTINRPNGAVTCHVTGDHRQFNRSHLVVFHFHQESWQSLNTSRGVQLPPTHPPWQKWVYYTQEPPTFLRETHSDIALLFENSINVLATHMRSSDVPLPYGEFRPRWSSMPFDQVPTGVNHAFGKRKLAAILVSNCGRDATRGGVENGRFAFVQQLQKLMPLDVYRQCGIQVPECASSCDVYRQHRCLSKLGQMYKFYLSLENSDCDDYITEKYWKNALRYSMVPVVRGKRNNYDTIAVPGSFIHVDRFPSIRALAQYLVLLDHNDFLYNRYFTWKSRYSVVDSRLTSDCSQDISQVDSKLCRWAIDNWDQAPKRYTLSEHIDRFGHCSRPDLV